MDMTAFTAMLECGKRGGWAHGNYKSTVINLSHMFHLTTWLEAGGLRRPLCSEHNITSMGVEYTVNDVYETRLLSRRGLRERLH